MISLLLQRRTVGLREVKESVQGLTAKWQSQDSKPDLPGPKAEALTQDITTSQKLL